MFKVFLVRFGYKVEMCMSFRSVEWGIEFIFMIEIKCEKLYIFVLNKI